MKYNPDKFKFNFWHKKTDADYFNVILCVAALKSANTRFNGIFDFIK